jgi:glycosyltransferase involved in cell wall biosynthesis
MRVLHITPTYFSSQIGGGERYPLELAKALSKYIDVELITFGNSSNKHSYETLEINECVAFTALSPLFTSHNPLPLSISFLRRIGEADIVHIHQFSTTISTIAILYSRRKGKPVCLTDHAGGFRFLSLSPLVAKFINLYLPVSRFSQKMLKKYNGRNYSVIYGGVDTTKFRPIVIEKENNKILYVGKITPRKGIDVLIKAIQELNARLYICGAFKDTSLEKKYFRLLKMLDKNNKVIFKFNVSDQELVREYNSALITVLPSVYIDCYQRKYTMPELLGLVLLESMACGTPVICSDAGGIPEIVENEKTGFIVPPGDIRSLREKITYFIENIDESKRMGRNAREIVLKKYTWDVVAKRCLYAYKRLI